MAVKITEICITCDACLQHCPVNAIVDDSANPLGLSRYYVYPEKCIECVGVFDVPQCAAICPSEGCITWDYPFTQEFTSHFLNNEAYSLRVKAEKMQTPLVKEQKFRQEIPLEQRDGTHGVQSPPPKLL